MAIVVAEEELCRSCRIIFGSDLKVSRGFLQYLQLSGIKKAYRKKALELHPDRGFCQSLTLQQGLANQFIDVHQAYEKLVTYLEARDKGFELNVSSRSSSIRKDRDNVKRPTHQTSTVSTKKFYREKTTDFQPKKNNGGLQKNPYGPPLDLKSLYRGALPNYQLLFGRYLYYSGLINLHTIGHALVWQRSQRPRVGEIGQRMGWLDEQDTLKILRQRKDRQLFGELALNLGILTREQLQIILLHQKNLHKRIGQYFVKKNYWDNVMLGEYIAAHRIHNSKVSNLFV